MGKVQRSLPETCLCQLGQKSRPANKDLFAVEFLAPLRKMPSVIFLQSNASEGNSPKPVANVSLCGLPL